MENFSLFYSNEEDALLSYSDIRMYQNTWNNVDLERKGAIPNSKIPELLRQLTGKFMHFNEGPFLCNSYCICTFNYRSCPFNEETISK